MEYKNRDDWVTLNTDASFNPYTKIGGYGIWITHSTFILKYGGRFNKTLLDSNEAEIKAVINALYLLNKNVLRKFRVAVFNCDNNVVRRIINKHKIPDVFKLWGEELLMALRQFEYAYAKDIKGHVRGDSPRQYVNTWCDKASHYFARKGGHSDLVLIDKQASGNTV